jgi:tRNA(Ile)-lysidine synthase
MEDSSNESNKYTRNFFRNELLPAIRQVFPQADDNLLRNAERIQSVLPIYHLGFETIKKKLAEEDGQVLRMPILKLQPYLHTAFLFELLQDYGFTEKQLPDIRHLADATNGRFVRSQTHQVIRHNRWLIVAPLITDTIIFVLEEGQTDLHFTNGIIGAKRYGKEKWKLDSSPYTAQLDAKAISFPMVLRRWKAGDYFYPLGMKKKKKLARFFIDNKLSKNEKENIWILESNRKIAWVIGHRIDDRFKVSDQTQEVLEFKWTPLSEQSSTSRR